MMRRKLLNRASAQQHRDKKRELMTELCVTLKRLKGDNKHILEKSTVDQVKPIHYRRESKPRKTQKD